MWLLSRGANPTLRDARGQDCRMWANEIMGVRGALQKAKEREERGALAPQSADVMALADHLGDNNFTLLLVLITRKLHNNVVCDKYDLTGVSSAGDEHLMWIAEAALNAPLPPGLDSF